MNRLVTTLLAWLGLWLAAAPTALAANYSFPNTMPAGCAKTTGVPNGDYSCGALSLGYQDSITITGQKPAILRINGGLSTDTSSINTGGNASDLSIVVSGTLTPGYQAALNANISAASVAGSNATRVTWGGSISTSGALVIGEQSTVAGSLSSASGAISIGQNSVVTGNVSSSAGGSISVGYAAEVQGTVSTSAAITLAQNARVLGTITGGSGALSIGYAANVAGAVSTSSGAITLAQSAVAQACVQVTNGSGAIQIGYQAQVAKVCCGALGSCGSSCVQNSSTYAMPGLCSAPAAALHHLELQHGSGTGLTCTPSTITIKACQNAACSTAYTGGVSGTLSAIGGSVVWPAGAGFSIGAGSSSTTLALQATTTATTVLGSSGSTPGASNATSCNFGSPACSFSAADSGLVLDAPDLRAESSNPMTVSAVRKSDNSAACVPAFASVSKAVTFKCSYSNPATGTRPVRVGGVALNSGNNTAAACDAGGRALTLAFDANGTASTTLIYADAGRMGLSASYTGSGSDAGLVMTGSNSFIAAPYDFSVTGISSAAIAAGSAFSATVTARNYAGAATPNFGRETAPEGATLGFVRTHPNGSGAVSGSFSGSLGAFSNGVATGSNLVYSEVGQGNVSAVLASGSYLGSGQTLAGASEGDLVWCANEDGICVLPTGATVTMYYQAWGHGRTKVVSGLSGTIACNNATFGDPEASWGKGCLYAATSGTRGWATAAATFKPHHFDLANTPACGAFSYAGQPFVTTATARNASGATTLNYDGGANTSPNFAKATTLGEAVALGVGVGSLSANSLAASAFVAGVGTASPAYSYSSKTTAPQSLVLRATDADSVSSSGYAEPAMALRSGRLRLSNAFGKASAALQLPVVAEYWAGNTWQLNSADSCTSLAGASVALGNARNASGAATTATSSAGALAISSGSGSITLAAPSPAGSSLTLDIALNLGGSTGDQSCNNSHPNSTGAGKAWLRAQNGSCAATADRDPAARASFGIFSAETRKTVHVRDIF